MDAKKNSNEPHVQCVISFDPSDPKSVNELLSKHGPEGLYEIAGVLLKAADEDVSSALKDS